MSLVLRFMRAWLCVLLLSAAHTPARADFFDQAADVISAGFDIVIPGEFHIDDVEARVGAGAGVAPDFLGADSHEFKILPLFDFNYRDKIRITGNTLRITAFQTDNFRVGFLGAWRSGRNEKNAPALDGLGDIDRAVELGGFAEWRRRQLVLRGRFGYDAASGHEGLVAEAQVEHGIWRNHDERIAVLGGVGATWASGNYMSRYFGISGTQAQASGLPAFEAKAGIRDVSGRLVGRYRLDDRWTLLGLARYTRLTGDAADSPLVRQRGSRDQFLAGLGMMYGF